MKRTQSRLLVWLLCLSTSLGFTSSRVSTRFERVWDKVYLKYVCKDDMSAHF
jgi:hypothetical protein